MNDGEAVRVEQTGIAVVHEGDIVYAAPGSQASIAAVTDATGVHYYFPVEIEVRSSPPADTEDIVGSALDALAAHLGRA